ncbi:MAG: M56 family metallopeptidase [Ruminococcaceae bacterium]|nr:M56 family metallopeptidase [Oscillospiraceae bacterium]
MNLLTMSLTGGVFIGVTLLLRAIFQHIVPRRAFLSLWLVANALLLIPLRLPTPVSIYALVEAPAPVAQSFTVQVTDAAAQAVPAAAASASLPVPTILWLLGAVIVLGCVLFAHAKNLRQFRFAVPVAEHPAVLPARVRVKRLDGLGAPLTYGLFRPTILLPAGEKLTEEQLHHIYLHELCHIRHFDVARKYVLLLTLAIHWFNPLVWGMTYAAMQDMEMRCDACVVQALGAKKAYATTLVQMETGKMQRILEAGFSFCATNNRLKALIRLKKRSILSIVLALVLCAATIAVFATDAMGLAAADPAPAVSAPQEEELPPEEPEPPKQENTPTVIFDEPEEPKEEEEPEPIPEPEPPEEEAAPEEEAPPKPEPTPEEKPEEPKPEPEPEPEPPASEEYPEEPGPIGTLPTEAPTPTYLGEIHLTCGATWSYSFSADRPYIAGLNDYTGLNHAIGSYANGLQTVTVIAGAPGSYPVWVAPSDPGYPESYLLTLIVTEGEYEE